MHVHLEIIRMRIDYMKLKLRIASVYTSINFQLGSSVVKYGIHVASS